MPTRRLSGIATSASVPDNGGDNSGGGGTYVDDVFSTYVYEGTDSSTQHQIQNGIDLSGEGGLVWIKKRDSIVADTDHCLYDTERGDKFLASNKPNGEGAGDVASFNDDGWTFNASTGLGSDYDGSKYTSWTFRKAPNFFDVVTYTGTGSSPNSIPHNLGSVPGFIVAKPYSRPGNWVVAAFDGTNYRQLGLNNNAPSYASFPVSNIATSTTIDVGYMGLNLDGSANFLDETHVAYLFAHDDSDESMIKCGSYTGNGEEKGPEIDLGFEPQFIMVKSSNKSSNWIMLDSMRGVVTGGWDDDLYANLTYTGAPNIDFMEFTATGFTPKNNNGETNQSQTDYIYVAIRRPSRPASEMTPEELFSVQVGDLTGPPTFVTGFVTDFEFYKNVNAETNYFAASRLTGTGRLATNSSDAEGESGVLTWDYMNGFRDGTLSSDYYSWLWRRAPGFMDVVAYEGDGVAGGYRYIDHGLTVVPEMIWLKRRDATGDWHVDTPLYDGEGLKHLRLNESKQGNGNGAMNTAFFNANYFGVFKGGQGDQAGGDYIAYLFASVPGISKVGSYTGTGAEIDVDCGFTTGARFVLIKRTDDTGDWYVWDTLRGITTGNDPYLLLNTTDAQVTNTDYIDPLLSGFKVTASAPAAINASGGEYIFYSIA